MSEPPFQTWAQALQHARRLGVDRLDAQLLATHVLQRPRSWLLAHDTDLLDAEHRQQLLRLLTERAEGMPLAYLVGEKEFHGLTLRVDGATLIPRPDTETLVAQALQRLPEGAALQVLDLGTGSGAIALALAHDRPAAHITAIDASAAALDIARANAARLGLTVRFLHGSWFTPLPPGERFHLIVSNPPYIAEHDPHLPALRHEPRTALTSGPDGLNDLRHICRHAPGALHDGGWLLLEHGYDQADPVQALLRDHGFIEVFTVRDLGGQPRCTGGRRKA